MDSGMICRSTVSLLALASALLATVSGCKKEEQAPPPAVEVKVVEAIQRDVPIINEWVGQTTGAVDLEIRARVNGWLQGIHFKEGTEVKKGALLYTIDDSELREQVAQAQAKLAEARTLFVRARSDVDRYTPLAAAGAVSKRDLEQAVAEAGARQGEVDAAQANLNVAQINLSYATVKAPIDGLVGISAARVGDFVGRPPNPVILNTISRVDSVHVRFAISEQEYLNLVKRFPGASAGVAPREKKVQFEMIFADGTVYPLKGTVEYAQREIDAATGTLRVEASFANPGRTVKPGQFARVRAVFDERKGAIVIPARAVTELQGQYVVYVVGPDNKAQFRRLQVGPKLGNIQVVEQGVSLGEKVVVEGMLRIRPDMVVAPETVPYPSDSVSTHALPGGK